MTFRVTLLAPLVLLAGCSDGGDDGEAASMAAPVSLPAPYDTADLANGKRVFAQCRSCHTVADGGPNLVGPNLHGLFERRIGTRPGYTYSAAAKAAGFQWEPARLDQWLADPRGFLPGTKMAFAGVKDPAGRRDVIAYLLVETKAPAAR